MPKVYIINKTCHDHSDAKRFGDLVYLSEGSMNRYATSNIFRLFMPILKDSSPDDFILPTGLTIMNNIACAIFGSLHGRINMLIYRNTRKSGEKSEYVDRKIIIREEVSGDD